MSVIVTHREIEQREVARKDTAKPTFVMLEELNENRMADNIITALMIYSHANELNTEPYPFTIEVRSVTRRDARRVMAQLFHHIAYAQTNWDLGYTVQWWWRTPSSAGFGPLWIGIGVSGIYEMSR